MDTKIERAHHVETTLDDNSPLIGREASYLMLLYTLSKKWRHIFLEL